MIVEVVYLVHVGFEKKKAKKIYRGSLWIRAFFGLSLFDWSVDTFVDNLALFVHQLKAESIYKECQSQRRQRPQPR